MLPLVNVHVFCMQRYTRGRLSISFLTSIFQPFNKRQRITKNHQQRNNNKQFLFQNKMAIARPMLKIVIFRFEPNNFKTDNVLQGIHKLFALLGLTRKKVKQFLNQMQSSFAGRQQQKWELQHRCWMQWKHRESWSASDISSCPSCTYALNASMLAHHDHVLPFFLLQ